MESELSRQLASGVIDSLLDLSRSTGSRLGQRDQTMDQLGTDALDRFWEELARVLDDGPVLERSQTLLASFLEDLKRSSFRQLRDQGGVDALINELDGLNFSPSTVLPLGLKTNKHPPLGSHHKWSSNQAPVSRQGIKRFVIVHGLNDSSSQSPVTLSAGVEQGTPFAEPSESSRKQRP